MDRKEKKPTERKRNVKYPYDFYNVDKDVDKE